MPGTSSSGFESALKLVAATELKVLLNPFTMIESGGADIVVRRVRLPNIML